MTPEEFDKKIEERLNSIKQTLIIKGKEYRRNNNPFHNFEKGAKRKNIQPTRVLDGFLEKHLISYDDMLYDIDEGKNISNEIIKEKFGDIINYFIIQEIMIEDKFTNFF